MEEGAFVIDGPVLVQEALVAGLTVQEAFATADADEAALDALAAAGVEVHEVRAEVLARAVDTVTPHGLAAIATRVEGSIADAIEAAVAGPVVLVLVDVSDPGNAGTLLRAAEASGAAAVIFCGTSVDPANAKCVRGSAGALFHVPVAIAGDAVAVIEQLAARGVRTAATVVREGTAYDRADLRGPIAFVLGSEAHGLPPAVVAAVSEHLTIPMAGRSESLNVAMAGSVLCFEAQRQRRTQPQPIGDGPA